MEKPQYYTKLEEYYGQSNEPKQVFIALENASDSSKLISEFTDRHPELTDYAIDKHEEDPGKTYINYLNSAIALIAPWTLVRQLVGDQAIRTIAPDEPTLDIDDEDF